MSSTSEALVQLAEQKEQLRIIANRYLESEDRLPVNCTMQEIIDVLDEYDEYSYMNAFLNSIEVFPDKDYSINDTKGHIEKIRTYAFYYNTALKSINLPNCSNLGYPSTLTGLSNLESIVTGAVTGGQGAATTSRQIFTDSLLNLKEIYAPKLTSVEGGDNSSAFNNCPSLTKIYAPKLTTLQSASWGSWFKGNASMVNYNFPKLKIIGGNANTSSNYGMFSGNNSLVSVMMSGENGTLNSLLPTTSLSFVAFVLTGQQSCTLSNSTLATQIASSRIIFYVPSVLLSTYQSATNWVTVHQAKTDGQGNYNGIQAIEPNINYLRELGVDFSFTQYANKKWENNQLVTDGTIGEEVDS